MGLVGMEGAEEGAFKRDSFTTLANERVGEETDETAAARRGIIGRCGLDVVEERDMVEGRPRRRDMGRCTVGGLGGLRDDLKAE